MMTMKISCAVLLAVAASVVVADESAEASSDGATAVVQAEKETPKVAFTTLPLCRLVEGDVFVRPFGSREWVPVEEGHFYPLGTSFRTSGTGRLTVAFSSDSFASISGDAEFSTRAQPLGVRSRTVVLARGTLELKLADNLPEGVFFIAAPGFVVKNPAGESRYVYEDMGDGDKVTVCCRTGTLGVEGRHFDIPVMRTANEVVIRTSRDQLSTFLYGTGGDYVVKLDKNLRMREEFGDDGRLKRKIEREVAEFHLSPATKVIINRSVPAIGERMSAFIMAFDASGERVGEGISVCEGRAEINSGEVIDRKINSEELAKRAAAATESAAKDAETTSDVEPKADEKTSEKETTSENKEEE